MTKASLGIMTIYTPTTPPFPEKAFFKSIILAGKAEGIPVIVFHPNRVNFQAMTVKGYSLNQDGKWTSLTVPVPTYIYDRCFYLGREYNGAYKSSVSKLLRLKHIHFLGIGLKGKWQMYQAVSQHPILSKYLPATEVYDNPKQLKQWLNNYPSLILKPIHGSLGMGVIKVSQKTDEVIYVEGRGQTNTPFSKTFSTFQSTIYFLHSIMQSRKYLIQPYLTLKTKGEVPFDVRILVQKNGSGRWSSIGKAIRLGAHQSITSNLHGGGTAFSFEKFCKQNYTSSEMESISSHLSTIERLLPDYLERVHGPLLELGIDVGIDQNRNVWLIEVNSKPGRQIFEQLKDKDSITQSQLNPLFYAKYLMENA